MQNSVETPTLLQKQIQEDYNNPSDVLELLNISPINPEKDGISDFTFQKLNKLELNLESKAIHNLSMPLENTQTVLMEENVI